MQRKSSFAGKTLCRKLNINKRTFERKFGPNIVQPEHMKDGKTKYISFHRPDLTRNPMLFYGKAIFWDPFTVKDWKISTVSSLDSPCANCNTMENIEMHHIKHIRTLNTKLNVFDKMVAEMNRKQVPLCKNCHREVQKGKYHGKSMKFLKP